MRAAMMTTRPPSPMAVVGGAGHVLGALVGSAVVTILREQLQLILPHLLGHDGNFEMILFGIINYTYTWYDPKGGIGPQEFADMAVELAKAFGGTDGYKYVNGVLDKAAGDLRPVEVQAMRAARA